MTRRSIIILASLAVMCAVPIRSAAEPFVAYSAKGDAPLPRIVLQHDPATASGADWRKIQNPPWHDVRPAVVMGRAASYLQEALLRMTGREFEVVSSTDLSRGLVLVLADDAPPEIQQDPDVRAALAPMPDDQYAVNEAFYVRSESERVVMVANKPEGLTHAVVELLESVGYEVLGMGPNWVHAPDYRTRDLVFDLNRGGRPSFYIRALSPTSGQRYGVGTIMGDLPDPADENVDASFWRWSIGSRIFGKSMPPFPGHALQGYHAAVLDHMRATESTDGFLAVAARLGPEATRPAAAEDNKGWLWLNSDTEGDAAGLAYISTGTEWRAQNPKYLHCSLDLSVRFVREILVASMIQRAQKSFEERPDDLVVFGMDAEDGGGFSEIGERVRYPQWYPAYLAEEGVPFGQPYVLNGFKGLDQPRELWDPTAASDHMFGCANWLLREFDSWVESLPAEEQLTASGKSKKALVRCSFYSYNFHDVPPNFNVDPRVRVMIAGYPKHRGRGKWEAFRTQTDLAQAFQLMLPREPSGDYRIISLAYYWDQGPTGIPANWDASPAALVDSYHGAYAAGYRAISMETDFNFGKFGLAYYLISKLLWDTSLSPEALNSLRDRWLRRAYGSAWQQMNAYYDFMLRSNYPVNGPNTWAKAIRMIDAADKQLAGTDEAAAQARLDDLKQFWYYHYLFDSGKYDTTSPETREYLWKGQMSYMVAMHVVARAHFKTNAVREAVGPEIAAGPAHYTRAETAAWWQKVLDHWQEVPVRLFSDATLADGRRGRDVDLHDLVAVKEFQDERPDSPLIYNSGYMDPVPVLMLARRPGDIVGFQLIWPFNANDNYYRQRKVHYGVDIWDPKRQQWDAWIDSTMTTKESVAFTTAGGEIRQLLDVRLEAPRQGTYRIEFGRGGNAARLASLAYDAVNEKYAETIPFTYFTRASGLTQSPVYLYIPKGTVSVDLEVWDTYKRKTLHLFTGLPSGGQKPARKVDISAMGPHVVPLEPGEDGTIAMISGNGFAFPYLYSIPTLWAKTPSALLVPKAIAEADGLTPIE